MKTRHLFAASLIIFLIAGCARHQGNRDDADIDFVLTPDSSALRMVSLPEFVLQEIQQDTLTSEKGERVFAVYREDDPDRPVQGRYTAEQTSLVFTPQKGFQKGATYQVECYIKKETFNAKDLVTGRQQLFKPRVFKKMFRF